MTDPVSQHTHPLFDDPSLAWGPPLTDALVAEVEQTLGLALPADYVSALRACNGGRLRRTTLPDGSFARRIHFRDLAGIGYPEGLEASARLCREWDYPTPSLVLSAEGPTALLLDYRRCGASGEPAVVFVDTDHEVDGRPAEWTLALDFGAFAAALSYWTRRTRFAVCGMVHADEVLDAAGAVGAVGSIREDHDGGQIRSLEGWTAAEPGPPLLRLLPAHRKNGSRRLAELDAPLFVAEVNVTAPDAFVEQLAAVLPGRVVRL